MISRSHTELEPVFDAIARRAERLCDGMFANVLRFDGELLHFVMTSNKEAEFLARLRKIYPMRPDGTHVAGRVILNRSTVVMEDALVDPLYPRELALAGRWRRMLGVPMMRGDTPLGVILVGWLEPGPVPKVYEELLRTFADQAVIAVENVRLFNETKEALEQQTATSDILRVISQSQTDVQPVFDTIAEAALKLCRASSANVFTFDGALMDLAAVLSAHPEGATAIRQAYPRPLRHRCQSGSDGLRSRHDYRCAGRPGVGDSRRGHCRWFPEHPGRAADPRRARGWGDRRRPARAGPFAEELSALLQTFADQAVIAIENVRLFKELEARTTQLTRSVGELQALGEVGQAVSSTLDLETVLRTIVARATELAGMDGGSIYEYDEVREVFHLHTTHRLPAEVVDALRASPIPKGEGALGQLAVTGEVVQIREIADEAVYKSRVRKMLLRSGYRSLLAVPLLREDHLLGGLVVNRATPGEFAPEVIDLLKTFATQSALAIQNARLFREIELR